MKTRRLTLYMLSLGALLSILLFEAPTSMAKGRLAGVKVCIDPGHGGTDPGAVNGEFALEEKEINLDVSYGLKTLLEDEGAMVVMTREGDEAKTNADRYTFCNSEQATILVSVHTNSVTDESWDGSMSLWGPSADPGLAQAIHDIMYPFLRDSAPAEVEDFRDFGVDRFASGVLFKCDMPATMMEPLFMSNPHEARLLVGRIFDDPEIGNFSQGCEAFSCRRGQIAQAIHLGVLNYFGAVEPPPIPGPQESMHVAAIDMWSQKKGSGYFIYTQVTMLDSSEQPVTGALVSVTTAQPDGSTVSSTGTTGEDGRTILKLRSDQPGTYASTVTGVNKAGWTYDESSNIETSEMIILP